MKTVNKSMKSRIAELLAVTMMMSLSGVPTAFADGADRAGNGGDALICDGKLPVVLDSYEGEQIFKQKASLSPDQSYFNSVQQVIDRIVSKDPMRGLEIQGYWDELKQALPLAEIGKTNKVVRFQTDKLQEVDDEMILQIPTGCRLQQLVLQVEEKFTAHDAWSENVPRYSIQKQLWDQLDSVQRTVIIMHELWYRSFLGKGAKSSRNARALNAIFFTDHYKDFTFRGYLDLINKTELKNFVFKTPFKPVESSAVYQPCGLSKDYFTFNGQGVDEHSSQTTVDRGLVCFDVSLDTTISKNNFAYIDKIFVDEISGEPVLYRLRPLTGYGVAVSSGPSTFRFNGVKVKTKSGVPLEANFNANGSLRLVTARSVMKVVIKGGQVIKNPDHDVIFQ